jgi:TctA family transporter
MEMDMLHSAGTALLIILDPIRLAYLFGGVCMGLALGILPGIGGVAGLALLLPRACLLRVKTRMPPECSHVSFGQAYRAAPPTVVRSMPGTLSQSL